MAKSVKDMVAEANAEVPRIEVTDAKSLLQSGKAVALDVRNAAELAAGKVKGAVHVPRGLLEFKADPASPSHEASLDPDKTVLVYCASGGRAALAGKTLKELGYSDVRNIGGYKDWVEGGGETE